MSFRFLSAIFNRTFYHNPKTVLSLPVTPRKITCWHFCLMLFLLLFRYFCLFLLFVCCSRQSGTMGKSDSDRLYWTFMFNAKTLVYINTLLARGLCTQWRCLFVVFFLNSIRFVLPFTAFSPTHHETSQSHQNFICASILWFLREYSEKNDTVVWKACFLEQKSL